MPVTPTGNHHTTRARSRSEAVDHNSRITVTHGAVHELTNDGSAASWGLRAAFARRPSLPGCTGVSTDTALNTTGEHVKAQDWLRNSASSCAILPVFPSIVTAVSNRPHSTLVRTSLVNDIELNHPSPERISPLIRLQHSLVASSSRRRQLDNPEYRDSVSPRSLIRAATPHNNINAGSSNVLQKCDFLAKSADLQKENQALRAMLEEVQRQLTVAKRSTLSAASLRPRIVKEEDSSTTSLALNIQAKLLHAHLNLLANRPEAAERNAIAAVEIAQGNLENLNTVAQCFYWRGVSELRCGKFAESAGSLRRALPFKATLTEDNRVEQMLRKAEAGLVNLQRGVTATTTPSLGSRRHRDAPCTLLFDSPRSSSRKSSHKKRYSLSSSLPTAPARYTYLPADSHSFKSSTTTHYDTSAIAEPFTPQRRRHSVVITIDEEDTIPPLPSSADAHDSDSSTSSASFSSLPATPTSATLPGPGLLQSRRRSKIADEEAQEPSEVDVEGGEGGYLVALQSAVPVLARSIERPAGHNRIASLVVGDEEMQSPKAVPKLWKRLSGAWT